MHLVIFLKVLRHRDSQSVVRNLLKKFKFNFKTKKNGKEIKIYLIEPAGLNMHK